MYVPSTQSTRFSPKQADFSPLELVQGAHVPGSPWNRKAKQGLSQPLARSAHLLPGRWVCRGLHNGKPFRQERGSQFPSIEGWLREPAREWDAEVQAQAVKEAWQGFEPTFPVSRVGVPCLCLFHPWA